MEKLDIKNILIDLVSFFNQIIKFTRLVAFITLSIFRNNNLRKLTTWRHLFQQLNEKK